MTSKPWEYIEEDDEPSLVMGAKQTCGEGRIDCVRCGVT